MVRHFQYFTRLGQLEVDLLSALEKSPEKVAAGKLMWKEGDPSEEMAVLSKGWAFSSYTLEDGSRMILDIFLPGDVIGLREFSARTHQANVETVTECTLCRFPLRHLDDIFENSPRLTHTFFSIAATQQSMLVERMINLGRRSAQTRLSHFICEMRSRLSRTNPDLEKDFRLPLSQQMLADTMGLTPVHVSRVFTQLREKGLVYRDRHQVSIPDLDRLIGFADFDGSYLRM
ncbi:Crp/Fnr family transcriptional regulator [Kushneria aurantia]|uniref:Crp/Fnr family transcriptional regulator n=1 Tax=Kushneria aurantia TaxID=504092 RepID=A0ABV6G7X3_9GAMM|nr:Crp/Fnr family transcriptional regulator [Kushneria aurantia]